MGEAIIASLLQKKLCKPSDISVNDISQDRCEYLKKKYSIDIKPSAREAVNGKDVIVLAVKPQNIAETLFALKGNIQLGQLLLSIAAGVTIKTIIAGTDHIQIVRSMPNTPAQLGLGMTGWTATKEVNVEQKNNARDILLAAMGKEIYFDKEEALDMVTPSAAAVRLTFTSFRKL